MLLTESSPDLTCVEEECFPKFRKHVAEVLDSVKICRMREPMARMRWMDGQRGRPSENAFNVTKDPGSSNVQSNCTSV